MAINTTQSLASRAGVFEQCAARLSVVYRSALLCDISPCYSPEGEPEYYRAQRSWMPQTKASRKRLSQKLIQDTLSMYDSDAKLQALFTGGGDREAVMEQLKAFTSMLDALTHGFALAYRQPTKRGGALKRISSLKALGRREWSRQRKKGSAPSRELRQPGAAGPREQELPPLAPVTQHASGSEAPEPEPELDFDDDLEVVVSRV